MYWFWLCDGIGIAIGIGIGVGVAVGILVLVSVLVSGISIGGHLCRRWFWRWCEYG